MRHLIWIFLVISSIASASCMPPNPIPTDSQLELIKRSTLSLIDKDFLDQNGLNVYRLFLPNKYKKVSIDRAYLSIWDGDDLTFHSSIGIFESIDLNESYLEFSLNRLNPGAPVIKIVYGSKCYNMHLLTIENIQELKELHDDREERYFERQNNFILKGRE